VEVRYVPGTGVLLAAGQRWLLVDALASPALVDPLWELLASPAPVLEQITGMLVEHLGEDVSFAMLDTSPGSPATLSRGAAHVITADDLRTTLSLRPGRAAGSLRLVAGVVPADAVDVPTEPRPSLPVVAPGLIDGIPPDILASSTTRPGSDKEPGRELEMESGRRSTTTVPEPIDQTVRRSPDAAADHDGHTTFRPTGRPQSPPPDPPGLHLQQRTHETVLAVRCPADHVTAAFSPTCRVCAAAVAPQEPQRIPRPQLGVVRLPEGETVPLDRGVVFGRRPSAPPGSTDWPHLVRLPQGSSYVSRTHLKLELDGWLVLATDLGSRGGTTLRVPGRPPERIRAHETYVWEPGQVLDLADSYEILYETTADTTTGTGGTP